MVVFGNGALRAQYYILTLQRMFKSTSSGYRVDKLGFVSCIRPLKIFCQSLGHIGPVVMDKTLKYRKSSYRIACLLDLPFTKELIASSNSSIVIGSIKFGSISLHASFGWM